MIITQTPLRISFAGGGSDLPSFYRQFGGAVVSTSIDKYVYVSLNKKFDERIRLSYSKTENVERADQIEHRIVREALKEMDVHGGVEITSVADIPSSGTGLGSSSAFTVGLLHALHAYKSNYVALTELAAQACHVEIELCGDQIGKQDQYASACGGLNLIRFERDDRVVVEPIACGRGVMEDLDSSLIAFYTGKTRSAGSILVEQTQSAGADFETQDLLKKMTQLAFDLRRELTRGNGDALGEILDAGWNLKRKVHSGISNPEIDEWYELAKRAGALGGKLLGAGGGGFLLFYAPEHLHSQIEAALPLRRIDMGLDPVGSRMLLYQNPEPRKSRSAAAPALTT